MFEHTFALHRFGFQNHDGTFSERQKQTQSTPGTGCTVRTNEAITVACVGDCDLLGHKLEFTSFHNRMYQTNQTKAKVK